MEVSSISFVPNSVNVTNAPVKHKLSTSSRLYRTPLSFLCLNSRREGGCSHRVRSLLNLRQRPLGALVRDLARRTCLVERWIAGGFG